MVRDNELRCIHRQDIKHHPKCFQKGLIKRDYVTEPVAKAVSNNAKILLLDIETSPISVLCWGLWDQDINIGAIMQDWHLIAWSCKWLFSKDIMSDALTQTEALEHDDSRVCMSIWKLLNEADIVISHNGNNFDIKRLNTRFLYHEMMPPKAYQSIDTLKVAKETFNFSSNKLDYINEYLGLPGKEKVDFDIWRKCFEGDIEAIKRLEAYNRNDTEILEDLYLKLRPYIKGHPNMNLWSADNVSVCPNCGSSKLKWEGYYYTYTGRYEAFRCVKCGAIGRSRKLDLDKEKRAAIVR